VPTLNLPSTAAVRVLKAAGVEFVAHVYDYVERGGTRHSAEALGVDEHRVVKTLVMESRGREGKPQPLLVLMHGDREVSTRELARQIGAREVAPATAAAVEKHTGYVPGGVSPFGTRRSLPTYVEASILSLPITSPGVPRVSMPKPLATRACRRFNWKSFMKQLPGPD